MKLTLNLLVCLLFLMSCQKDERVFSQDLISIPALFEDQTAAALVKAEKFEEALGVYIDILEKEPGQAQVHSNVGVIMSQIQKEDEALKSWQHALKLAEERKDLATLFAVNFNLGAYYGAKKNVAEALKYYQAALDIVPTSNEAKTNIELLTQSQNQGGNGDNKNQDQKDQQNQQNKGQDQKDQKNKDQSKDQKDKDQSKDGKDDQKKQDPKDEQGKDQKRESSGKYKPRPFKGDQLNEGDVKKILGELRSQEQKIRANFDKKEQKDSGNEKDW